MIIINTSGTHLTIPIHNKIDMPAYNQNVPAADNALVIDRNVEATIKLQTQLVAVAIPFALPRRDNVNNSLWMIQGT